VSKRRKCLFGAAGLAAIAVLVLVLCPKPDLYGGTTFSTAVTDRHGRLMRLALAGDDRYRLRTPLGGISRNAIDATLLYEDRHFYAHPGFNPASLMRAAWSTYVRRSRVMGASTITMQLARLRFDLDTRTVHGKLTQIARAMQLERHYDKDALLEAYLNLAPYGGNVEGIGTAALIYFDKPASSLTLPEALALAVIPQNPGRRDPSTRSGHAEVLAARERLLQGWEVERPLDDDARAQFGLPLAVRGTTDLPFAAPHFSLAVLESANGNRSTVATTLDLGAQSLLETLIGRYVDRGRSRGIRNASALLIDHRTMEVLASVGSADFFDDAIEGQVDGTRARRSPGSTLKPFVYGLAIDRGLIHPGSLLKDAPARFAAYTPENFDRGFMGPVTANDALIYSRNVPAIQLLSQVGHEAFHAFLVESGVHELKEADHYGLAMVLGGNEVTMHELVTQYAMLANGGRLREIRTRLDDLDTHGDRRLMSAEASFLVLDMLRDSPRPDAIGVPGRGGTVPIAWKTGTSYAFRDAWTVGVLGPYVLAVWVGNFDGSANPAFVGRSAAAPLFLEIADALSAGLDAARYGREPDTDLNVRKVDVCAATGDLPGRYCPRIEKAWFIPGVSPIRVSDVHRAIRVDTDTGLRVCSFSPGNTTTAIYEFWPSDILDLYRRAGISIKRPPAWDAGCEPGAREAAGLPPRISSLSAGVTYHVRRSRADDERIPLAATTDSDVKQLYWFVDDQYISTVGRDETAFWHAAPGEHRVLAVDDLGRSHAVDITVRSTM